MAVKSYVFSNEYGQLGFTVSSDGGTTPTQIPLGWVELTYDTVTLAQLQTGTDTTGYLISPKILADYIASLDATNVSY